MDVVRHHCGTAREVEAFVNRQIILRPGERFCHLPDFEAILVEVSLHTQAFVFSHQSLADFEHRFGSGKCKARSYCISQTPPAVESPDQTNAVAVGGFRSLMQLWAKAAVGKNKTADDP